MATHPFLEHPGPIPFAHRGGALEGAENTVAAFQASVDLGYRYVETDVHVTADGVVVAFHDEHLDRVTDRTGAIAECTWDEVSKARVNGTESIPRLDDLLTTFPDLRINIDPKTDSVVEPLGDVLERHDALERVCVGSFSDDRIEALQRRFGTALCAALGPTGVRRLAVAQFGIPVGGFRAHTVQVPHYHKRVRLVTRLFVHRARRHEMDVHVWTIDDPDEMRALLDRGARGLMTDRPALLKQVLVERGEWH